MGEVSLGQKTQSEVDLFQSDMGRELLLADIIPVLLRGWLAIRPQVKLDMEAAGYAEEDQHGKRVHLIHGFR